MLWKRSLDMNIAQMPVAQELFMQWRSARGRLNEPRLKPFRRDWEQLLEDGRIFSAMERFDAERDARALQQAGLLDLKFTKYRLDQIQRVAIPLAQENRWSELFGFIPPDDAESKLIQEYPWPPGLAFIPNARVNIRFTDLRAIADFLHQPDPCDVPIKERSLQIFGDEKRLDLLRQSSLFREGRLTLTQLRCFPVVEPIGWVRGPIPNAPLIVLENAATWHSFARANERSQQFSAVLYGQGNCFAERVPFIRQIFKEIGGAQPLFYFGDLDAAGLRIPARAKRIAQQIGLPPIEPHVLTYRSLLDFAHNATKHNLHPATESDFQWLGELSTEAWRLIGSDKRLAQEHVGANLLCSILED